jgi:tRNA G18 (ribose-2'-O)-methylase SpoU
MRVIINNVRSCHNVGSIFRTADALGVSEILLCGYSPGPIDKFGLPSKPFIKVSLGAENSVKWRKFASVGMAIKYCKGLGCEVVGLELAEGAIPYTKFKSKKEVALVVGNERRGISKMTLARMDKVIFIPMKGAKESLNVSIAFAVAAFGLLES